jgi:hypothetical protein
MRITGSDPVQVEGSLEHQQRGQWFEIGSVFTLDDSGEQINDAGAVGTTGNVNIQVLSYDNFMVRDLGTR